MTNHDPELNEDDEDFPLYESKTQRKKEMTALQDLGETLLELVPSQIAKIPLDPKLAEAIAFARTITSHGARRRQLQYIGKLMRSVDPEPIRLALNKIKQEDYALRAQFQSVENWRERFITSGDEALQEFLLDPKHAATDIQHLRQLVRKVQQDQKAGKKRGSEKVLFQYLRKIIIG